LEQEGSNIFLAASKDRWLKKPGLKVAKLTNDKVFLEYRDVFSHGNF
jgi:hypothetical protein